MNASDENIAWIREHMQQTIEARRKADSMLELTTGATIAAWMLVLFDALTERPLWWAAVMITSSLVFRLLKLYAQKSQSK